MENSSESKSGKVGNPEVGVKDASQVSSNHVVSAEAIAEARQREDAENAAAEDLVIELARKRFQSSVPESVTSTSDKFAKAYSRFDPIDRRIQPAEMWKYTDPEFARHGRL